MSASGTPSVDLDELLKPSCGEHLAWYPGVPYNSTEVADPDIAGVGVSVRLCPTESSLLMYSKGHRIIHSDSLPGIHLDGRCLLLRLAAG